MKLGVNIDHVATLRQARREFDPDPVAAARLSLKAGADSIVAHLREDRRHMQDHDITILRKTITGRFNLEMSMNSEIVDMALDIEPDQATLVPERRQEITTEGGLDVVSQFSKVKKTIATLQKQKILASLFIAPSKLQISKSFDAGATMIELHTGPYALASTRPAIHKELNKIKRATDFARKLGITVNAGHGLNYQNTKAITRIDGIEELNIGHAIISRAVFVGIQTAVEEMIALIRKR